MNHLKLQRKSIIMEQICNNIIFFLLMNVFIAQILGMVLATLWILFAHAALTRSKIPNITFCIVLYTLVKDKSSSTTSKLKTSFICHLNLPHSANFSYTEIKVSILLRIAQFSTQLSATFVKLIGLMVHYFESSNFWSPSAS